MHGVEYDRDYFERGLETGKSTYKNYTWLPQYTIPMAMTIIDWLGIHRSAKILDYGCAKGYLVKAMRLLHRESWGVDISSYAIQNLDEEVKRYCFKINGNFLMGPGVHTFPQHFDYCIAKDVFEHIPEPPLLDVLKWINADFLFVIVPLGNGTNFFAPMNGLDVTHCNCWDIDIWDEVISGQGWSLIHKTIKIEGIKDSYYDKYPNAHGFLTFRNRNKM